MRRNTFTCNQCTKLARFGTLMMYMFSCNVKPEAQTGVALITREDMSALALLQEYLSNY